MLIGAYEKDDGVKKNYSRYLLALAFATKKKIGQMYLKLSHTTPGGVLFLPRRWAGSRGGINSRKKIFNHNKKAV